MSENPRHAQAPTNTFTNENSVSDFNDFPAGSFGVTHEENSVAATPSPHVEQFDYRQHPMTEEVVDQLPPKLTTEHVEAHITETPVSRFRENPLEISPTLPDQQPVPMQEAQGATPDTTTSKKEGRWNKLSRRQKISYIAAATAVTGAVLSIPTISKNFQLASDIPEIAGGGNANSAEIVEPDDMSDSEWIRTHPDSNNVAATPSAIDSLPENTFTPPTESQNSPKIDPEGATSEQFRTLDRSEQVEYATDEIIERRSKSYRTIYNSEINLPKDNDTPEAYTEKVNRIISADIFSITRLGETNQQEAKKLLSALIPNESYYRIMETMIDNRQTGDHSGKIVTPGSPSTTDGNQVSLEYSLQNPVRQDISTYLVVQEGGADPSDSIYTIHRAQLIAQ